MHFLIVDDDPANRRLRRASLEAEGHSVVEAVDGLTALEVLASGNVDAVISGTATDDSSAGRTPAARAGADGHSLEPAPVQAYLSVLVRKLERRNAELEQAVAGLQTAHDEIVDLNRTLEERVAQRTAGLDAAYKELEAFSFSVSHDLRAPLRRICGFSELVAQNANGLDAENRGYLEHIMRATKEMDRLIDALLDLARTGRTQLQLVPVDLETVLEEALSAVYQDTRGRTIKWVRTRLPVVRADATLIRQVFINLLSNAIKYTRPRDIAQIEIGTHRGRADEAIVFVRDNGVGFDVRQAGGLFNAFQRLHSSEQFEGVGVGLANAHRVITRHGGAIWAEASAGVGATFFFRLARAQAAWPGIEAPVGEANPSCAESVAHGEDTGC